MNLETEKTLAHLKSIEQIDTQYTINEFVGFCQSYLKNPIFTKKSAEHSLILGTSNFRHPALAAILWGHLIWHFIHFVSKNSYRVI